MERIPHSQSQRKMPGALHLAVVLGLLLLLWVAFGGNDFTAVIIGVPTVLLALAAALWLSPSWEIRVNPFAFAMFVPVFLVLSLAGGMDVARRALSPTPRLDPALITYALRLPKGTPRDFFVLMISLLPGTLSAEMEGDTLTVHVLDQQQDNAAALASLEQRIAGVFRQSLHEQEETGA